eukprot:NODE_13376_length_1169_cov_4.642035.p1 GENE.NODE_13376_length_1169_cov_4.642035~~NODE_13376_length_1169_cov_4.642035.p1  ORF type:complete len:254 (+),score=55.30 NODE_13376_length_1169_cov_4.642035:24-764(+)
MASDPDVLRRLSSLPQRNHRSQSAVVSDMSDMPDRHCRSRRSRRFSWRPSTALAADVLSPMPVPLTRRRRRRGLLLSCCLLAAALPGCGGESTARLQELAEELPEGVNRADDAPILRLQGFGDGVGAEVAAEAPLLAPALMPLPDAWLGCSSSWLERCAGMQELAELSGGWPEPPASTVAASGRFGSTARLSEGGCPLVKAFFSSSSPLSRSNALAMTERHLAAAFPSLRYLKVDTDQMGLGALMS